MKVLSHSIANCDKIWVLLPATENNIEIFLSVYGTLNKLQEMLSDPRGLEGRTLVWLDSRWALHLPAVAMHSTITNTGGLLAGLQWCAAASVVVAAKAVIFELRFSKREQLTRKQTSKRMEIELNGLYSCLE